MDIEYVSHKYPGESYLNQEATFWKLEPVYRCFWDIFDYYGIKPMTLVTGQGYHFVFDVNSYDKHYNDDSKQVTDAANELVEAGHLEPTLEGKYEHIPRDQKRKRIVEADMGRAFDAAGKLLEYVVHKAIEMLPSYGLRIPVGIGDLIPGNEKRELINLDLSAFAAPLFTRPVRTAFSIHDKHREKGLPIPVQIAIPRYTPCNGNELSLDEVFFNRRHFRNATNYAAAITTNIPDCSKGALLLLEEYLHSDLCKFHLDFDKTEQDRPEEWYKTYDRFNLSEVPPCVARAVANPNPALLQPTQVQTLVRTLTGKRWWHPKHVAGLIRSKYERDHHWSINWKKQDANRHANVWIRFYGGLLAMGLDKRIDQNCVSHQEKGLCFARFCGYNLRDYQ